VIDQLKRELEKIFNYHESSIQKEILITEPNKINIDLNNELNYTRDILAKISKMLQAEKSKNEQLEQQVNQLQEELNMLRKNSNMASDDKEEIKENATNRSSEDSEESDNKSDISDESNLYSLAIKFPDKVQMPKNEEPDKQMFKLDFAKVNAKYLSSANNMKGKITVNVPVQQKKNSKQEKKKTNNKNDDSDLDLIIEKLRNDLKNSNKTVKDLTSKLDKQKNLNKDMKQKIGKLNENLKMVNTKIETLETQIKKVNADTKLNSSMGNSSSFVIGTEENHHVCNTESNVGDMYVNTENVNHGYNTIDCDNAK